MLKSLKIDSSILSMNTKYDNKLTAVCYTLNFSPNNDQHKSSQILAIMLE